MRAQVADAFGVEPKAVRVLTGHVGGSFGMKGAVSGISSASCTARERSAGR